MGDGGLKSASNVRQGLTVNNLFTAVKEFEDINSDKKSFFETENQA